MLRLFQPGDRISYRGSYSQTTNFPCLSDVESSGSGELEFTYQYDQSIFGTDEVSIPSVRQTTTIFQDGVFSDSIATTFEQENNGTLNLLIDEFLEKRFINTLQDFLAGNRFLFLQSPLQTGAIWQDSQDFLTADGELAIYSINAQVFSAQRLSTSVGTLDTFRVVISFNIDPPAPTPGFPANFAPYESRLDWRIAPSVGLVSGTEVFGSPGLCARSIPEYQTRISYEIVSKSF